MDSLSDLIPPFFASIETGKVYQSNNSFNTARAPSSKLNRIAIALPGLSAGGTEHVVKNLANHWVSCGHDVTIVTLESEAVEPYYEMDPRIKIVHLNLPPQRLPRIQAAWLVARRVIAFRRVLKELSPNAIVSFLTRTNVKVLIASIDLEIPVIVSERNNPALQHFGAFWNILRNWLYPRAFGLITMTKGAMNYFPPSIRRRSWIIPNPVVLPNGCRKTSEGNRLVAVGRLVPQKGFDLLIDAFASVADRNPTWTLVIWGEGPDRRALEALRDRHGLKDRIFLPGVSERPGSWLETADAFVLSSRFEGWGIALLEAMAWGLPCVAFNCEWGPSEMIEDGVDGILVPRENVPALAERLSEVMSNPKLRHQLSEAAKASTLRFSQPRVMAAWDEVIHMALASSRTSVEVIK